MSLLTRHPWKLYMLGLAAALIIVAARSWP